MASEELSVRLQHAHPLDEGLTPSVVFNGVPSSCFPCSTGLGSSFDVDLAYKIGQALGDEARAKGGVL